MSVPASINVERLSDRWVVRGTGDWTISTLGDVDASLRQLGTEKFAAIEFDTSAVTSFDTAAAWMVERLRRDAQKTGATFHHLDTNERHLRLVEVVGPHTQDDGPIERSRSLLPINVFEALGQAVTGMARDMVMAFYLLGASIRGPRAAGRSGRRFRPKSIINQLDHMGLKAVPVIAVMSFLIGAIIAQQGAFQLKQFGEELLVVDLVGILLLREIGVLLTAIMVAGRTGSAITAEIGTMKMREEIDALQVIGLNPIGVLVFPRLVALIIALPILTLLADFAGIAGAMVVADLYVGITPGQFLDALQASVGSNHLISGLIKAPCMAIIIGLVATVEGLKVGGSAESLGRHTTSAVVRSIFVVIVVDGLFAMYYAAVDY